MNTLHTLFMASLCTLLTAGVQLQAQDADHSIDLNEIDDYISLPHSNSTFSIGTGVQRTIEFWMSTRENNSGYQTLYVKNGEFGIYLLNNELIVNVANGNVDHASGKYLNDGNWHHISLVLREGQVNGSELWINGVQEFSFTYTFNNINATAEIGSSYSGAYWPYSGKVDEFRFWTYARFESQLSVATNPSSYTASDWGLGAYYPMNNPSGSSVFDVTGNNVTATLYNNTNPRKNGFTIPPDYTSPEFVSDPSLAFNSVDSVVVSFEVNERSEMFYVLMAAGASTPTKAEIFNGTGAGGVSALNSGTLQFPNGDLSKTISFDGLAEGTGYTLFSILRDVPEQNEMNTLHVYDFTTHSNDQGNAIQLSAANDYVEAYADFPSVLEPSSGLTVETWVKFDEFPSNSEVHTLFDKTNGSTGYRLYLEDGIIKAEVFNSSAVQGDLSIVNVLFTDVWHHLAMTYDGSYIRIYVDGELSNSIAFSGSIGQNSTPIKLGDGFNGALDGTRLWNVARTANEIESSLSSPLTGYETGLVFNYKFDLSTAADFYNPVGIADYDGRARVVNISDPNTAWVSSEAYTVTELPNFVETPLIRQDIGGAEVFATLDNPANLYYIVTTTETVSLTASDIKNGTGNASGAITSGSVSIPTADEESYFSISGLDKFSSYRIYFALETNGVPALLNHQISTQLFSTTTDEPGNAIGLDDEYDLIELYENFPDSLRPSSEITVETWAKISEPAYGGSNQGLQQLISYGSSGAGFDMYMYAGEFGFHFFNTDNQFSKVLTSVNSTTFYPNTWYHLAATYDGSFIRLYVDGELVTTKAANGEILESSGSIQIGQSMDGALDGSRIWKVARTQSEIQSTMTQQISGFHEGLVLNFNYDQTDGQELYNTAGIYGFDGRAIVYEYANTSWEPSEAYNLTVIPLFVNDSPTLSVGSDSVAVQVETDTPGTVYYALFSLDEVSLTATDIKNGTGNASSAQLLGSVEIPNANTPTEFTIDGLTSGFPYYLYFAIDNEQETAIIANQVTTRSFNTSVIGDGTALTFDGENSKVYLFSTDPIDTLSDELTIEAWINASEWKENSYNGSIVDKSTNALYGYKLSVGDNGKAEFSVTTHDGIDPNKEHVITKSVMELNTWNHLAGVYDGDSLYVYINGVLEGAVAHSGTVLVGDENNPAGPLGIGWSQYFETQSEDRLFAGSIDEVRIWGVAKSKADIRSAMQSQLVGDENELRLYYKFDDFEGNRVRDNSSGEIKYDANTSNINTGSPEVGGGWIYSEAFDAPIGGPDFQNATPAITETLGNLATINIDVSELPTIRYVTVPVGSTPPNPYQIDNGVNYPGGTIINAGTIDTLISGSIVLSNLAPETAYDFYTYAQTVSNGYKQLEPTKVTFNSGQLKSAFTKQSPELLSSTQSTAKVRFSVNIPSRVYYVVQNDGETPPTKEEVLALTSSAGSPVASSSFLLNNSNLTTEIDIQGLSPEMEYDVYAVNVSYPNAEEAETLDPVAFEIQTIESVGTALYSVASEDMLVGTLNRNFPKATIEFWLNTTGTNNGEVLDSDRSNSSYGFRIISNENAGLNIDFKNVSGVQSLGNDNSANSWYHIALSWDITTNEFVSYFNGLETVRTTIDMGEQYILNLELFGNVSFEGQIDEFRIWDDIRSVSEIQMYMSRPLSGTEENLVLYYDFESYNGQFVTDLSGNGYNGEVVNATLPERLQPSGAMIDYFAPVFEVAPYITNIVSSRFTVNTQLSESGTVHALVWEANTAEPTAQEVKSGVTSKHSVDVHSSFDIESWDNGSTFVIEGLQPNQAYHAWIIAEDDADSPNLQAEPVKLEFTTSDNALPIISNLQIIGYDFAVSEELKASFSFVDADGDSASEAKYKWFIADDVTGTNSVVIAGATSSTYSPSPVDLGKYVSFEAIPYDGELYGDTVQSAFMGPVIAPSSFDERALSLDGVDSYMSTSSPLSLSNTSFTISFWSRRAANPTGGFVLSADATLENYQSIYLGFPNGGNDFQFGFFGDELTAANLTSTAGWIHWAVTFNHSNNERVIFQDGVEVASDIAGNAFQGSGEIEIGRFREQYFEGLVDDVTIWDHIRPDSLIRRDMFKQLKGTEAGLIAYWPIKDGLVSKSVTDHSSNANTGTLVGSAQTSNGTIRPQGTFLTGNSGWRLLTAPHDSLTYGQFLKDIWTQGYSGASTTSGSSNVYWYDEPTRTWNAPTDSSNIVGTGSNEGSSFGRGILVYVYDIGGWPKKLTIPGNYNIENMPMSLTETPIENDIQQGWHVIGNPYPFSINWTDLVARSGLTDISPVIFIYDPSNNSGDGGYRVNYGFDIPNLPGIIAHNGVIEPFQAFWVRTSGNESSGSISFNAADISGEDGILYGKLNPQELADNTQKYLLFTVEQGGKSSSSMLQLANGEPITTAHPMNLSADPFEFGLNGTHGELLAYEKTPIITDGEIQRAMHFNSNMEEEIKLNVSGFENFEGEVLIKLRDTFTDEEYFLDGSHSIMLPAFATTNKESGDSKNAESALKALTSATLNNAATPRFELTILTGKAVFTEKKPDTPEVFELEQNYPNPFNPSSTIQFGLPEVADVRLEVFNMLGQKVSVLVNNQKMPAGRYSVDFDASNLASGMYIYRLQAGNIVFTKKMTLIK